MSKKLALLVALLVIMPLAFFGCKGKVEKAEDTMMVDAGTALPGQEDMTVTQAIEPAQTVAMETIPPTAMPPAAMEQSTAVPPVKEVAQNRNKDIQKALKAAGFYAGAIDGKIGP
ncbi:MAG: hypothetical protein WC779_08010, partial [Candidatus Omnitrophota bacterium]